MQQSFIQLAPIGLIAHRQIHPCLFIDDGFVMGEGIKAGFAVIGAHAAFANAAEAHFARRKMDDHIIDAAAAIGKLGAYAPKISSPMTASDSLT